MEANDFAQPAGDDGPIDLSGNCNGGECDLQALANAAADSVAADGEGEMDELEALRRKVKDLEESLQAEDDKHKRLLADFQNFRNRASRDTQLGIDQAKRQIMLEVLQVLDSFDRCMESAYGSAEDLRAGVELIQKQFYDALRRLGVSQIEIRHGDAFDANTAEALTTVDGTGLPDGSVADVCEKGFSLGGRLLRPARVVVARGSGSS